jgi:hypothetical protein
MYLDQENIHTYLVGVEPDLSEKGHERAIKE